MYCASNGVTCNINFTQGIDLDSFGTFENVSQTVQITTEGQYLLSLEWLPSIQSPLTTKFMTVEVNSTRVLNISFGPNANFSTHVSETLLALPAGQATLNMRMYGYTPDQFGAHIGQVSLRPLTFFDSGF